MITSFRFACVCGLQKEQASMSQKLHSVLSACMWTAQCWLEHKVLDFKFGRNPCASQVLWKFSPVTAEDWVKFWQLCEA